MIKGKEGPRETVGNSLLAVGQLDGAAVPVRLAMFVNRLLDLLNVASMAPSTLSNAILQILQSER
jgi:hypothetical protein